MSLDSWSIASGVQGATGKAPEESDSGVLSATTATKPVVPWASRSRSRVERHALGRPVGVAPQEPEQRYGGTITILPFDLGGEHPVGAERLDDLLGDWREPNRLFSIEIAVRFWRLTCDLEA